MTDNDTPSLDVLWKMYQEHCTQGRHHETQGSTATPNNGPRLALTHGARSFLCPSSVSLLFLCPERSTLLGFQNHGASFNR